MECPRCHREIGENDQYCHRCGWNTEYIVPTLVDTSVPTTRVCPICRSDKIDRIVNPVVCPVCGAYVGFNRGILDKRLTDTARVWTLKPLFFFTDVLGLSRRVARNLANAGIYPLEALALTKDRAMGIRRFGELSYKELDNARNNWKPNN